MVGREERGVDEEGMVVEEVRGYLYFLFGGGVGGVHGWGTILEII